MQGVHRRLQGVRDRVFELESSRRNSVILVTEERSCWRAVARSVKSSTEELSVEENPVARCAQVRISTKCRRECSEEQEKVEEEKLRRESGEKYSRREVPEVSIKVSGQDSFRRETNDSRPSDLGELRGRLTVRCFGTSWFGKFGRIVSVESRSLKL
jgi:hypothetical protein